MRPLWKMVGQLLVKLTVHLAGSPVLILFETSVYTPVHTYTQEHTHACVQTAAQIHISTYKHTHRIHDSSALSYMHKHVYIPNTYIHAYICTHAHKPFINTHTSIETCAHPHHLYIHIKT